MSSPALHLESLNNSQRKAAGFGEPVPDQPLRAGPLLIIAGAGTGKTNTLAHRVAHLVINGVDPSRIMLLTFCGAMPRAVVSTSPVVFSLHARVQTLSGGQTRHLAYRPKAPGAPV